MGVGVFQKSAGIIAAFVVLAAMPLGAQDRITPDVCALSAAELALDAALTDDLANAEPNGIGRLWRITGPSGQVSYLWGSLHSSDPAILALPPEVRQAMDGARVLVLESDPRAKSRTEIAERALQAGVWLAPADQPWDKPWLDGAERVWAEDRITGLTQDEGTFSALTDMGVAYFLLSDPCEDFSTGALPTQDLRFLLMAHEAGLPVASLEPWDAFLTEMSQPDRRKEVQALARTNAAFLNPEGYHEARAAGFRLYLTGQIGVLHAAHTRYLSERFGAGQAQQLAELADRYLIVERNQRFVRALGKHVDEGGAMIVTGAFHLPGEQGLVALLQEKGYVVERVPVAGEVN